jgi:hypothetical protein
MANSGMTPTCAQPIARSITPTITIILIVIRPDRPSDAIGLTEPVPEVDRLTALAAEGPPRKVVGRVADLSVADRAADVHALFITSASAERKRPGRRGARTAVRIRSPG